MSILLELSFEQEETRCPAYGIDRQDSVSEQIVERVRILLNKLRMSVFTNLLQGTDKKCVSTDGFTALAVRKNVKTEVCPRHSTSKCPSASFHEPVHEVPGI